jgi:hypothetical protein
MKKFIFIVVPNQTHFESTKVNYEAKNFMNYL